MGDPAKIPAPAAPAIKRNNPVNPQELSQNIPKTEMKRLLEALLAKQQKLHKEKYDHLVKEKDVEIVQCKKEKDELMAHTEEVEQELLDLKDECVVKGKIREETVRTQETQLRLIKTQGDLAKKSLALDAMEVERDELRNRVKAMEAILREHNETTQNFKIVLETEVAELRCRLRNAEEKNLHLIHKALGHLMPGRTLLGSDLEMVLKDCRNNVPRNRFMCGTHCRKKTSHKETSLSESSGKIVDPSSEDDDDEDDVEESEPTSSYEEVSTSSSAATQSKKISRSNITNNPRCPSWSRETICMGLSVVILGLAYFVRSINSNCRYQTLPYSSPFTLQEY